VTRVVHGVPTEQELTWHIQRGDPPAEEPAHLVVERILRENGIKIVQHGGGEYDGYTFEVSDGGLTYPLVCNYAGRNMCCACAWALMSGDCAHRRAVKEWLFRRRWPDPPPPAPGEPPPPPRPFALW